MSIYLGKNVLVCLCRYQNGKKSTKRFETFLVMHYTVFTATKLKWSGTFLWPFLNIVHGTYSLVLATSYATKV